MKIRKLKNTYINLRRKYMHRITEEYEQEKYINEMLEETIERLKAGKGVFYTEEEFWNMVEEMEKEDDEERVSYYI